MKTQHLILGIIAILLVGGGYFLLKGQSTPKMVPTADTAIVKNETTAQQGSTDSLASRYVNYTAENLGKATVNNGKAVLFFAALKWCPSCQAADKDLKENFDKVPSDVSILKVDYDTAKELKQKYAITMQDTFVQVDNQGKEITRWNSGGQGIKALLANAK